MRTSSFLSGILCGGFFLFFPPSLFAAPLDGLTQTAGASVVEKEKKTLSITTDASPQAKRIHEWADARAQEVLNNLIKAEKTEAENSCFVRSGWRIQGEYRLRLGYTEFLDSVSLLRKTECLKNDVLELDNLLARMIREVSYSPTACLTDSPDLKEAEIFLSELFLLKRGLQKYGEEDRLVEQQDIDAKTHPLEENKEGKALRKKIGSSFYFSDPPEKEKKHYQDTTKCVRGSWLSFALVTAQIKLLMQSIKEVGKLFTDFRAQFDFTLNLERAEERGNASFQSWFDSNIGNELSRNIGPSRGDSKGARSRSREREISRLQAENGITREEAERLYENRGLVYTNDSANKHYKTLDEESEARNRDLADDIKKHPLCYDAKEIQKYDSLFSCFEKEEEKERNDKKRAAAIQETLDASRELGNEAEFMSAVVVPASFKIDDLTKHYEETTKLLRAFCIRHSSCHP